jgi:hypothetical protein
MKFQTILKTINEYPIFGELSSFVEDLSDNGKNVFHESMQSFCFFKLCKVFFNYFSRQHYCNGFIQRSCRFDQKLHPTNK